MAAIPIHPNAEPKGTPDAEPDWSDDIAKSRFSAWRVPVTQKLQWLQSDLDNSC